jgi:hypothetical protein
VVNRQGASILEVAVADRAVAHLEPRNDRETLPLEHVGGAADPGEMEDRLSLIPLFG